MMSQNLNRQTSAQSMSFAEASHAKTLPLHKFNGGLGQGLMVNEQDYGERSNVWPLTYDRECCFWRTCQASLVPDLDEFSETWPASGMMRNGIAFQPVLPAGLTSATVSGLLPTPAARDYRDVSKGKAFLSQRKRHSPSLATVLLESGIHWSRLSEAYENAMGFPLQWSAVE